MKPNKLPYLAPPVGSQWRSTDTRDPDRVVKIKELTPTHVVIENLIATRTHKIANSRFHKAFRPYLADPEAE